MKEEIKFLVELVVMVLLWPLIILFVDDDEFDSLDDIYDQWRFEHYGGSEE